MSSEIQTEAVIENTRKEASFNIPNFRKFDYCMKFFLVAFTLVRSALDTLIFKNQAIYFKVILISVDISLAFMVLTMITMLMRGLSIIN